MATVEEVPHVAVQIPKHEEKVSKIDSITKGIEKNPSMTLVIIVILLLIIIYIGFCSLKKKFFTKEKTTDIDTETDKLINSINDGV